MGPSKVSASVSSTTASLPMNTHPIAFDAIQVLSLRSLELLQNNHAVDTVAQLLLGLKFTNLSGEPSSYNAMTLRADGLKLIVGNKTYFETTRRAASTDLLTLLGSPGFEMPLDKVCHILELISASSFNTQKCRDEAIRQFRTLIPVIEHFASTNQADNTWMHKTTIGPIRQPNNGLYEILARTVSSLASTIKPFFSSDEQASDIFVDQVLFSPLTTSRFMILNAEILKILLRIAPQLLSEKRQALVITLLIAALHNNILASNATESQKKIVVQTLLKIDGQDFCNKHKLIMCRALGRVLNQPRIVANDVQKEETMQKLFDIDTKDFSHAHRDVIFWELSEFLEEDNLQTILYLARQKLLTLFIQGLTTMYLRDKCYALSNILRQSDIFIEEAQKKIAVQQLLILYNQRHGNALPGELCVYLGDILYQLPSVADQAQKKEVVQQLLAVDIQAIFHHCADATYGVFSTLLDLPSSIASDVQKEEVRQKLAQISPLRYPPTEMVRI